MRGRGALAGAMALVWSGAVSAGVAVAAAPAGVPAATGVHGGPAAVVDAGGPAESSPVPQPVPGGPAAVTVQGRTASGLQALLTVPQQLPLDPPTQPLARRAIDVGVANVSDAAYTGTLQISLTAVTAGGGAAAFPHTLQQQDGTGTWQNVPIAADQGATWSNTYPGVAVPAGGRVTEHFQMSAGTAPLTGVKVSVTMDGATATTTIPVTGMTFTVGGLPGTLQAGVAAPLTGALTNPTDVSYAGVGFGFSAQACGPAGGCLQAQDLDLEYQSGGVWTPVPLQTTAAGVVGTVGGGLAVKAAGTVAVQLRVTAAASVLALGPIQLALRADGLPVPAAASPQSVAVVPASTLSSGVRTDPSDETPSDGSSSETPSTSGSSQDAGAPADGASPTDGSTALAGVSTDASGGADGSTVAILAGMGALVVSVALLGWYFVWRKQQQARSAAAVPSAHYQEYEERMDHSGY